MLRYPSDQQHGPKNGKQNDLVRFMRRETANAVYVADCQKQDKENRAERKRYGSGHRLASTAGEQRSSER